MVDFVLKILRKFTKKGQILFFIPKDAQYYETYEKIIFQFLQFLDMIDSLLKILIKFTTI